MKYAVLILALMCSAVYAKPAKKVDMPRAELDNDAGGHIVLLKQRAGCPVDQHMSYSTSAKGDVIVGCWFVEGTDVMLVWSDGAVKVYPGSAFTYY